MSSAALLLAAALLIAVGPTRARARAASASPAVPDPQSGDSDALAAASTFDVLAACLASGMAVSTAAAAAAPSAPRPLADVAPPRRRPAGVGRRSRYGMVESRSAARQSRRSATSPGSAVGSIRYRACPRCRRSGRTVTPRRRIGGRRPGPEGVGADRRPTRIVLPACLRLPGHRPDRRRAGGRRAAVGPHMTACEPLVEPTGRKRNGGER